MSLLILDVVMGFGPNLNALSILLNKRVHETLKHSCKTRVNLNFFEKG